MTKATFSTSPAEIISKADWGKSDGLLPAIVQNPDNGQVLMLGYMNAEALTVTIEGGNVTFFSRSKQRLWVKGESSGNFLKFADVRIDCDYDALLVTAQPMGPTCHTGSISCFGNETVAPTLFLNELAALIANRSMRCRQEATPPVCLPRQSPYSPEGRRGGGRAGAGADDG